MDAILGRSCERIEIGLCVVAQNGMDTPIAVCGHIGEDGSDIFHQFPKHAARTAIFDRATPNVSQTVFILKYPLEERASATSVFLSRWRFLGLP